MKKKKPTGLRLLAFAALAASFAIPAFADANTWVYTPETHATIAPATAEGTIEGLDAKARGFSGTYAITVDKWYWTWCFSNEYPLCFDPTGLMFILK